MKPTLTWAACALSACLLAACGGADESQTETTAPEPPAEASADTPETGGETDTAAEEAAEPDPSPEFSSLPEPYKSASYETGKRVYLQCQSCHTLEEGGAVTLGPNLYGIFGTEAGTKEFDYSEALQEADFVWTPEKLGEWLANPRDFLPGNSMNFAGVRRDDERTAVIAYIMAETGYEPS